MLTKKNDDTFVQDLNYCISDDANMLTNTECTIPQQLLILTPYDFSMGDPVIVKVAATNAYGTSEFSELGQGAVV